MRKLLLIPVFLAMNSVVALAAFEHSHALYDKTLQRVVKDGFVDYAALKADSRDLDQYLSQSAQVTEAEFQAWGRDRQLAYLLNLYNAHVMQLIVRNYPTKSIKDIKNAFGQPIVSLFGQKISLDQLENERIRKPYNEPRIHFALVCAAKSCPPLRKEPYQGEKLNQQLEDQSRAFMADRKKNYLDTEQNTVYLSPYFKWFREDFEKASGSVLKFVKRYYSGLDESQTKIKYTDYDWSLNDASGKSS